MKSEIASIEALKKMTLKRFLSVRRFEKHGVRVKFTRLRMLNALENYFGRRGLNTTVGDLIERTKRSSPYGIRYMGKKTTEAMLKIFEGEKVPLFKTPILPFEHIVEEPSNWLEKMGLSREFIEKFQ